MEVRKKCRTFALSIRKEVRSLKERHKRDVGDPTRLSEFYDGTYEYLKSLGLEEI